jgi:hypothetical protein
MSGTKRTSAKSSRLYSFFEMRVMRTSSHEIHLGILAANEEFKRRHARPRVGQEEETEFFALVANLLKK